MRKPPPLVIVFLQKVLDQGAQLAKKLIQRPQTKEDVMDFESAFKKYFQSRFAKAPHLAQKRLKQSLFYSLFGKASRFRPQLCFAAAKALGQKPEKILPWAILLESAHCASLIHDDLPSMDNSLKRRGKACNHLIFGEDTALLAGTCLFIESFALMAHPLFKAKRAELLELLISKMGFEGLISGQAMDLKPSSPLSKRQFFQIIRLKTSSLIELACLGPLILWGKNQEQTEALTKYSQSLGRAYQLADDIQDNQTEALPRPALLKELKTATQNAKRSLKNFGAKAEGLKKLLLLNFNKAQKAAKS